MSEQHKKPLRRPPAPAESGEPADAGGDEVATALSAARIRSVSESTAVSTIMTPDVTALAPEASVGAATELFLERDVSAAPVVDAAWLPLAMVSKTDLLRYWLERTPRADALRQTGALKAPSPRHVQGRLDLASPESRARVGERSASAGTTGARAPASSDLEVADVTAPYVLSLHEDAPISVAAALMAYEHVHRLPIVSSHGDVVGIVSTLDIVRWLAETTGMGASE